MLIIRLARIYRKLRRKRAVSIGFVMGLLMTSILGNSICYYMFDGEAKGHNFGDAIWYSVVSITTIGYGDMSAESLPARLGTVFFVIILGMAVFSVILGMGIDWVTEQASRSHRGEGDALTADHILIVNFPTEARVRQIIAELRGDVEHTKKEIVVVSDSIDRLPMSDDGVIFIRGPVLEQETYRRAALEKASMAIVLATSYDDSGSDAVVASSVSVIDSINSKIHIVAECLNPKHRMLFDSVNCDAIVFSMQISGNLLAQEAHDPGLSQLIDTITSNFRGTTVYSTAVIDELQITYNELVKALLESDINVICVNRDEFSHTSFKHIKPQKDDRLIYAGEKRLSWAQIKHEAKL